jgi:DNA-binding transcriptional LysR family regulator
VNFQHLRHFIAVAEELHFGRAAERLGMAQPPLSQSIRRLEDSLGVTLFARTRRRVELTPAGATLLEHGRAIIDQVEYVQRALHHAGEAGVKRLTIGFTPNALSDVVPMMMRELRRLAPGVDIVLHEAYSSEQQVKLLKGELDLAFFQPVSRRIPGLEVRLAERSSVLVAIPEDWPLARKDRLTLADFDGVPLLLPPQSHRPEHHVLLMTMFSRLGVAPQITQEASYSYTRLKLVAAGLGLTLVSESTAPRGYPGVVMRKIDDLADDMHAEIMVAWRQGAPPSARSLFLTAYEAIRRNLPTDLRAESEDGAEPAHSVISKRMFLRLSESDGSRQAHANSGGASA